MHLSMEELRKMEQIDIRDAVQEELTDISGIEIDRKMPVPAKGWRIMCKSWEIRSL